jgi:hypothetical protein
MFYLKYFFQKVKLKNKEKKIPKKNNEKHQNFYQSHQSKSSPIK